MNVHPDLRRSLLVYQILGSALVAVGAVALVFPFTPTGQGLKGVVWVPTVVGLGMFAVGWAALILVPRWYRRATWVLENTPAEEMLMTLRKVRERHADESTTYSYYADLQPVDAPPGTPITEHQWVIPPRWDTKGLVLARVSVHRDPQPRSGMRVIVTDRGVLWPQGRTYT